jgi:signal transduction histidine kinase
MNKNLEDNHKLEKKSRLAQEYEVLHEVAKTLHRSDGMRPMLNSVLEILTQFDELRVEKKAGIFLSDPDKKVLRLYTTVGEFSDEFMQKEQEVPFGDCLCGRVALSGKLLMSDSCFTDARHERTFADMTAHGHYIVPLNSGGNVVGVMFLYTNVEPSWYAHSQEVLLSIGGLIADAIEKHRAEEELLKYRDHLQELVHSRTAGLKDAKQQLRDLGNRLQSIREEEKIRIAREIHDDLGQSLTALKMELFQLDKIAEGNPESIKAKINHMSGLLDDTVKSVQQIAMELRPPILDAFGLCEAIAWQVGEYEKRTDLKFQLNCLPEKVNISSDKQTTLFRILQETLTNIVRHADATRVEVCLENLNDNIILTVRDNGRGFDSVKIGDQKSLGLLGMRERALVWNGSFDIQGESGKGSTVTVKIPLR